MAQPASLYLARQLVREMPFAAQRTFRDAAAGAASTFIAAFDIGLAVTDQNQFLTPATNPSGDTYVQAIGPFLDCVAFTTGAGGGTLLIEMAVDYTCTLRTYTSTVVPASTLTNVAGLRITARFLRITFTNVTAAAVVEFGAYVRST